MVIYNLITNHFVVCRLIAKGKVTPGLWTIIARCIFLLEYLDDNLRKYTAFTICSLLFKKANNIEQPDFLQ